MFVCVRFRVDIDLYFICPETGLRTCFASVEVHLRVQIV